MSRQPSLSGAELCLWDVLLQLGYLFLGDWWQDLHSGHYKTQFCKTQRKLKTYFVGVPPVQLPCMMTVLRQSLRGPHSLKIGKARGTFLCRIAVCGGWC